MGRKSNLMNLRNVHKTKTNNEVSKIEVEKQSRRKFLVYAGAGVIAAGAGLTYLSSRGKNVFESVYDNLENYLDEYNIGRIGRVYEGDGKSVVVAARQSHTVESSDNMVGKLAKGLRDTRELNDFIKRGRALGVSEDELRIHVEKLEKNKEVYLSAANTLFRVSKSQQYITNMLNDIIKRQEKILIGIEGLVEKDKLMSDNPYLSNFGFDKIVFDRNGNPINEDPFVVFYTIPASFVLHGLHSSKVELIGLEDKLLYDESSKLVQSNDYKSEKFAELQVKRNEKAAEVITRRLKDSGLPVAGMIYGGSHFDESKYNPTITDYLDERRQGYIEFMPRDDEVIEGFK